MRVALEPFARACVESSLGRDLSLGTQVAVRHYTRRLESSRQPAPVPAFLHGGAAAGDSRIELELPVSEEVEAMLTGEACRQRVTVDLIVAHAVFVYLADLDAFTEECRSAQPEEGRSGLRYRFHARPLAPTAAWRCGQARPPLPGGGAECDGARAGGGWLGAS